MELQLFTHKNGFGKELASALNSGRFDAFRGAIAYVRNSGVGRIFASLQKFTSCGGTISIVAGIDQAHTTYQALLNLRTVTGDNLLIHHDRNLDITFHPKVYLFSNKKETRVFIGSSNLTAGGFYTNYEANVAISIDREKDDLQFLTAIEEYWSDLIAEGNTKVASPGLLDELLRKGAIGDETKHKTFKKIIEKVNSLPFKRANGKAVPPMNHGVVSALPSSANRFGMLLSGFDVSSRSQDPIVLIPVTALKERASFWNFPLLYTDSGSGYPELYVTTEVTVDGVVRPNQLGRIYYYDVKDEFRFQIEAVKRNGRAGDAIEIIRNPSKPVHYSVKLIRKGSPDYVTLLPKLVTKVSSQKRYGYF